MRMKPSPCTKCGVTHDGATDFDDPTSAPGAGDVSVCIYCGHVMIYSADMILRDPTTQEQLELAQDPDMVKVIKRMQDAVNEATRTVRPMGRA